YEFPLGTLTRSDDGLALIFRLSPAGGRGAGLDLVQQLLARADPATSHYQPAWARFMLSARIQEPHDVIVRLRGSHVLPAALLQSLLRGGSAGSDPGPYVPYTVFSRNEKATRFTANPIYAFRRPGQPAEIVERSFDDPQRLLIALKTGEIDL